MASLLWLHPGYILGLSKKNSEGYSAVVISPLLYFPLSQLNLFTFRPQMVTFCPIIAEGRRGGGGGGILLLGHGDPAALPLPLI